MVTLPILLSRYLHVRRLETGEQSTQYSVASRKFFVQLFQGAESAALILKSFNQFCLLERSRESSMSISGTPKHWITWERFWIKRDRRRTVCWIGIFLKLRILQIQPGYQCQGSDKMIAVMRSCPSRKLPN